MKRIYLLLFLIHITPIHAQKIIVVDSLSKEVIPFVNINHYNLGFYSNEFGTFKIPNTILSEIEINHLSYHSRKINVKNIKDTIFLVPKVTVLSEVIVSNKIPTVIKLKAEKKAKNFGSWVLQPNTEMITFIYPNKELLDTYISNIQIPFVKIFEKDLKDNTYAFIRLNIYSIKSDTIANVLFASEPIRVNGLAKDNLQVEINDSTKCKITKEGFAIGIEMIDYYQNGVLFEDQNIYLRPRLSSKENKNYKATTFIKYTFKKEDNFYSLNKFFEKGFNGNKHFFRNPSFGLVLNKYEN